MSRMGASKMIKHRARKAQLPAEIWAHRFRGTRITAYLRNGGKLEVADRVGGTRQPAPPSSTIASARRSRSTRSSGSTSECGWRQPSTGGENGSTSQMALYSDLSRLIRGQFDKHGIAYDRWMPLHRLTARYFEMSMRRIQPVPRRVHFSDQIHTSLGELSRRGKDDTAAQDAWGTVFRLRQLLVDGDNVNGLLTRNIGRAAALDGLLWHYGMHHFHLGRETDKDGFVQRSDHLLLAVVAPMDAYFVDVRPHPPPRGIGWVSQDLLRIVHSNWPKLIEVNVLHGISGDDLTDEEMQVLRRKNVNYAMNIDGKAIAPLLGGMAGDGSSVLCTLSASWLMKELRYHEEVLRTEEVR